jgi:hypothetical protein
MNQELQDKLFNTFPKLFKQKDLPKEKSAMCWGIDCPDEWYDAIRSACEVIENYINHYNKEQIEFTQIKEKFGKLCMYYNGKNEYVDGVISVTSRMVSKDNKSYMDGVIDAAKRIISNDPEVA